MNNLTLDNEIEIEFLFQQHLSPLDNWREEEFNKIIKDLEISETSYNGANQPGPARIDEQPSQINDVKSEEGAKECDSGSPGHSQGLGDSVQMPQESKKLVVCLSRLAEDITKTVQEKNDFGKVGSEFAHQSGSGNPSLEDKDSISAEKLKVPHPPPTFHVSTNSASGENSSEEMDIDVVTLDVQEPTPVSTNRDSAAAVDKKYFTDSKEVRRMKKKYVGKCQELDEAKDDIVELLKKSQEWRMDLTALEEDLEETKSQLRECRRINTMLISQIQNEDVRTKFNYILTRMVRMMNHLLSHEETKKIEIVQI